MRKGLAALLGVPFAAVTVWLLLPGPIAPFFWKPGWTLGPAGAFAVNEELRSAEHLPLVPAGRSPSAVGGAPESAAFCWGGLYTGLSDGTIVRLDLPGGTPHEVVKTGGRPLGLACHGDQLYIADSKRGLLRWSPKAGLEEIAHCPGKKQRYFTDGVAVDHDGLVWFTCPSTRWGLDEVQFDALESQPTGRLLTWDPDSKKKKKEDAVTVRLRDLSYANGVALDPAGEFILVAEFTAYRIRRLWLKGEKKGQVDILFDNLPGYPDNVWIGSEEGRRTLWVGFPVSREKKVDDNRQHPFVLRAFAKMPPELIRPAPHGWLIELDLEKKLDPEKKLKGEKKPEGEKKPPGPDDDPVDGLAHYILHNLQDPTGRLDQVTGAVVVDGKVYVTSNADSVDFLARWTPPRKDGASDGTEPYADPFKQHWTRLAARIFHYTPQGVDFFHIRYDWFLALERPWSKELFSNAAFLSSLGFVYDRQPGQKPEELLPIGFAKLDYVDEEEGGAKVQVVGTTCALCHTGQLHVRGRSYLVEGGQALHSVASPGRGQLVTTLSLAMLETSSNPFKFDRFAQRVLCPNGVPCDQYPAGKEALRRTFRRVFREMLATLGPEFGKYEWQEGPGRIDAFGHIANTVFGEYLKNQKNIQDARAPVDIAHVWDSWRFDFVQWTGTAGQAMGRNVGEASFGGNVQLLDRKRRALPPGQQYASTILVPEIYCLESTLESLEPPSWPEEWGSADKEAFKAGQCHFKRECSRCHRQQEKRPPDKPIEWIVSNYDVGTDGSSLAAQTSARYDLSALKPGKVSESAISGLGLAIPQVVDFQYNRLNLSAKDRARFNGFGRPPTAREPDGGYHARPLHGIWATPPFLHNGSVRSLYELLLPADRRAKRFWIGPNQEFDTRELGFARDPGAGSVEFDTARPGNGNMGHEYGTELTEEQRFQLLEYLKFLGRATEVVKAKDDPDERTESTGAEQFDQDGRSSACHRGLQGPAGEP